MSYCEFFFLSVVSFFRSFCLSVFLPGGEKDVEWVDGWSEWVSKTG